MLGYAQMVQRSAINLAVSFEKINRSLIFENKYKSLNYANKIFDLTHIPINIENTSFKYSGEKYAIENVSLKIISGQIIALCGENGSGKSTIVKLILGLYKPTEGSVKIYGNEAYNISNNVIPDKIGVVFQDFCVYPFTLRENVGFGDIKNIESKDKILNAINKGDATDILKQVGNLDAILSRELDNNGHELSGGQWQRLALARAYMSEKDIMIFDEPAAKLDPIAELKQFETIRESLKNKTAILISHRIGFARLADRIIVLKDGKIIEDGKHEDLLALDGEYKKMFDNQAKLYNLKDVEGVVYEH